ncbi:valine--tRNA ligase [bacterium]|nr:valine--tRNA ligase [bacterium]
MDKAYTALQHDLKWQKHWDKYNVAAPETVAQKHSKPTGKTFTIMMPPPNVTGALHQGHALFLALQDGLCRWRRMCGDEVLYLPGSDHASIAVQMLVARDLESKGINYKEIGREKFLEECWQWVKVYQPRIFSQMKSMGVTCDWSRVKFTLDDDLNDAVTHAFVTLFERGYIYRAQRLVNWSPKGQTVLSDLEVLFEERQTHLWNIRYYRSDDSTKYLVVSTTRPETLLGDSAVAVHPEDERYKDWIGKKLKLPLVDREIEVIADDFVDREFGSGAVKITPAHDFTDFEVGKRHNLQLHNVFTPDAKIVEGLSGEASSLAGLDRFDARKKIEARLEELKLLEGKENYKTRIGFSERWNDVVEPYLSNQWFCKMDSMAKAVSDDAKEGKITFTPQEFYNQFQRWMEDTKDWCVSRQLWWGQQIPAYHCKSCERFMVQRTVPEKCEHCGGVDLFQDPDVLDTWFSSGLWPFSTLGWPNEEAPDFKKFYPTQILETGFDIIFFWVARMLMMGRELTGKLPFDRVYMHPMVRDEHGHKMSKTKGNVIDPIDLIEKMGADTLRITLNALCVQGRDMRLSESKIEGYRNFINKVWNAVRFVLSAVESNSDPKWIQQRPQPGDMPSKWLMSRLDAVSRDVNKRWDEFKMQEGAELLYHFLWDDYCAWYLEISKTDKSKYSHVLVYVMSEYLKLLHPVCPHVTEELWHEMNGVSSEQTLALEAFPQGDSFPDSTAIAEFDFVAEFVKSIRNIRSENGVKPSKKIPLYIPKLDEKSSKILKENKDWFVSLCGVSDLSFSPAGTEAVATIVVNSITTSESFEALIPLSELVDVKEEITRLTKEIEKLSSYFDSQTKKLSNKSFVDKAPPEVVEKEKLKLEEIQGKLEKTKAALLSMEKMA